MNVTLNSTCTSAVISNSAAMTHYIDVDGPLTISIDANCLKIPIIFTDSNQYLDEANYLFTFTPAALGQSGSSFTNGVYHIEIYNGDLGEKEYFLMYVSCGIVCDLIEYYAANPKSLVYAYHEMLNSLNVCSTCDYAAACLLYQELQNVLNGTTNYDCGCN